MGGRPLSRRSGAKCLQQPLSIPAAIAVQSIFTNLLSLCVQADVSSRMSTCDRRAPAFFSGSSCRPPPLHMATMTTRSPTTRIPLAPDDLPATSLTSMCPCAPFLGLYQMVEPAQLMPQRALLSQLRRTSDQDPGL